MKLFVVASLLLVFAIPAVGATPIHPRVCTETTGDCPGFACAAADASARPTCVDPAGANQPPCLNALNSGCCNTTVCHVPIQCLEFYNRVTVGPVTITYGGCNAPSVHVDGSILQ